MKVFRPAAGLKINVWEGIAFIEIPARGFSRELLVERGKIHQPLRAYWTG